MSCTKTSKQPKEMTITCGEFFQKFNFSPILNRYCRLSQEYLILLTCRCRLRKKILKYTNLKLELRCAKTSLVIYIHFYSPRCHFYHADASSLGVVNWKKFLVWGHSSTDFTPKVTDQLWIFLFDLNLELHSGLKVRGSEINFIK